jgi:hypothetical protein
MNAIPETPNNNPEGWTHTLKPINWWGETPLVENIPPRISVEVYKANLANTFFQMLASQEE